MGSVYGQLAVWVVPNREANSILLYSEISIWDPNLISVHGYLVYTYSLPCGRSVPPRLL